MNFHSARCQLLDGDSNIHCVPPEAIQLRNDDLVIAFKSVCQSSEPWPLESRSGPRDRLGDDALWLDLEPCGTDVANLIFDRLIGS